jgi:hypothetical protein
MTTNLSDGESFGRWIDRHNCHRCHGKAVLVLGKRKKTTGQGNPGDKCDGCDDLS